MNRLEVDSVTLEFGSRTILSDVYMCFEQGEVTGILGRNGTGKSCLLNIIYGSLRAGYSNVRYNGAAIVKAYRHPEKVRYLPQTSFIPKFIKLERVLGRFGSDKEGFTDTFPEFRDQLSTRFGEFSFGQKRIIETWLILKSESDFVLLDEPFSYLAPLQIERFSEIIATEKMNKGIVITDHLYRDLLRVAGPLYLLHDRQSYRINDREELRRLGYLS